MARRTCDLSAGFHRFRGLRLVWLWSFHLEYPSDIGLEMQLEDDSTKVLLVTKCFWFLVTDTEITASFAVLPCRIGTFMQMLFCALARIAPTEGDHCCTGFFPFGVRAMI